MQTQVLKSQITNAACVLSKLAKEKGAETKVALDVDNTLADIEPCLKETITAAGKKIDMKKRKHYDPTKYGAKSEDFYKTYERFWSNPWAIRRLIEPSQLYPLLTNFKVDIVTSRPVSTLPNLELWLRINFPELLESNGNSSKIVSTDHKRIDGAKAQLHYSLYVDDNPYLAKAFEDREKEGILLLISWPYNEYMAFSNPNIIRVDSTASAVSTAVQIAEITKLKRD